MAKVGIILISDYHYGIVRNQYSLTELVRDYTKNQFELDDPISIRHIVAKDISSMCRVYPHKLEDLRSFIDSNDVTICFICLGLSNYKSGYSIEMFKTHYCGIIDEIYNLSDNIDCVLMSCQINNNLKGHFAKNYELVNNMIKDISLDYDTNILLPDIKLLFLNNGDYVISTRTIPNMVESISRYIYETS